MWKALGCGWGSVIGAQAAMLVERGPSYSFTALAEATSSRCNSEIKPLLHGGQRTPCFVCYPPFLVCSSPWADSKLQTQGKTCPSFFFCCCSFFFFFLCWLGVLCGIRLVIELAATQGDVAPLEQCSLSNSFTFSARNSVFVFMVCSVLSRWEQWAGFKNKFLTLLPCEFFLSCWASWPVF